MPAKKRERVSMVGMGADAFFAPPTTREIEEQENQQDSTPVQQHTSVPAKQSPGKTVNQQDSMMKATYYITTEQDMK